MKTVELTPSSLIALVLMFLQDAPPTMVDAFLVHVLSGLDGHPRVPYQVSHLEPFAAYLQPTIAAAVAAKQHELDLIATATADAAETWANKGHYR